MRKIGCGKSLLLVEIQSQKLLYKGWLREKRNTIQEGQGFYHVVLNVLSKKIMHGKSGSV